eukprot:TRINITY_DN59738_c0_g1_i1.p1 TRINITY_DN59738_c0_g1~~TRINITY_DN59738_c0_g1_i1.p1  ORF type:complete len:180 (+),score=11.74 TRINITY_DN59738_c0_g1_i1:52-591(+)
MANAIPVPPMPANTGVPAVPAALVANPVPTATEIGRISGIVQKFTTEFGMQPGNFPTAAELGAWQAYLAAVLMHSATVTGNMPAPVGGVYQDLCKTRCRNALRHNPGDLVELPLDAVGAAPAPPVGLAANPNTIAQLRGLTGAQAAHYLAFYGLPVAAGAGAAAANRLALADHIGISLN